MMRLLLAGVAAASLFTAMTAHAHDPTPLNSDREKDRMDRSQLATKFGPLPKPAAFLRIGDVSKTPTNEYWRWLDTGDAKFGKAQGVTVVYRAAQSEGDQLGQPAIAGDPVRKRCKGPFKNDQRIATC